MLQRKDKSSAPRRCTFLHPDGGEFYPRTHVILLGVGNGRHVIPLTYYILLLVVFFFFLVYYRTVIKSQWSEISQEWNGRWWTIGKGIWRGAAAGVLGSVSVSVTGWFRISVECKGGILITAGYEKRLTLLQSRRREIVVNNTVFVLDLLRFFPVPLSILRLCGYVRITTAVTASSRCGSLFRGVVRKGEVHFATGRSRGVGWRAFSASRDLGGAVPRSCYGRGIDLPPAGREDEWLGDWIQRREGVGATPVG